MGSTAKEKNLLQNEKTLSFKSWPQLRKEAFIKMAELLPLKVFLFTLKLCWNYLLIDWIMGWQMFSVNLVYISFKITITEEFKRKVEIFTVIMLHIGRALDKREYLMINFLVS